MNTDPQSYILSEDESKVIFERDIIPVELSALSLLEPEQEYISNEGAGDDDDTIGANPPPLAVLLVGQTGAGKTRTAPAIKAALTRLRGSGSSPNPRPLAHFVADTYKTYHPSYPALLSSPHPSLASPATSPDARRWLALAASYAAQRNADVLLESAARHPGDFADLARLFRHRRYRVEVVVLAVPAPLSRLGILVRFYEKLPEGGLRAGLPVRLTPRRVHDDSYAGLLDAAAFVDSGEDEGEDRDRGGGVVDQVVVVRRDNMVAYANERVTAGSSSSSSGTREWKQGPGGAADAVRLERRRPLTPAEKAGAELSLRRLREMNLPGLENQLVEIEGLLEPLLIESDDLTFPPLKPLSLPSLTHDLQFDAEAGLRLGMI
ncbi:zeta toxin-domain-containing protein [Hypoxylon crocopeplum]|nr:zeta toxin-domain-containing protein [Hypoxylon crocopeplum]